MHIFPDASVVLTTMICSSKRDCLFSTSYDGTIGLWELQWAKGTSHGDPNLSISLLVDPSMAMVACSL